MAGNSPFGRILVSNDDGIHAAGLKALEKIAHSLSDDVWVVAPETEQSGASHSLTLAHALRIREVSSRRFAVQGTPTDCVMLALNKIIEGARPTLVLSGVNRGGNLGEDVTYSGTVAAAMEGTMLNIPSIALSQVFSYKHKHVRWATAEHHAPGLIKQLVEAGWPRDVLININFPDLIHSAVKGTRVTVQGRRDIADLTVDERVDTRGHPYYWYGFRRSLGEPGPETDLGAIRDGYVSVTPLHLDLTHFEARETLGAALADSC
ncbi:MAG: 5'/3'-nucleotidase SurE [Sphingomonadales bacterium]